MSDLSIKANNKNIGSTNIYELKKDKTVEEAKLETDQNSQDEVYFKLNKKTYVAVGDNLDIESLKQGNVPAIMLIISDGNESKDIEVIHTNDEINSWNEGWEKGTGTVDKFFKAIEGSMAEISPNSIHQFIEPDELTTLPSGTEIGVHLDEPDNKPIYTDLQTDDSSTIEDNQIELNTNNISVHFTDVENGFASTDRIDKKMAKFISSAEETLDIALFELRSDVITDAILEKAKDPNIKIRVVTDDKHGIQKHGEKMQELKDAGIEVVDDSRSGLMHNKFVIVDNDKVWTGSMNATINGTSRNDNNALIIPSEKLAENYLTEFNEMFVDKKFGKTSPSDTPNRTVMVGNTKIESYFASEDQVISAVVSAIDKAEEDVKFMAFSFTHDDIGDKLVEKMSNDGIEVSGVFENRGGTTQYSEYGKLKAAGASVKVDGNKGTMHHKVFIIDEETVITGSFNFSNNASKSNDENLLIIKDKNIAKLYLEEYKDVFAIGKVK